MMDEQNRSKIHPEYEYVVLDRAWNSEEDSEWWYGQNNEEPFDPTPIGADSRLADILAHLGSEGFIVSTSGGVDEHGSGPTRLILVRVKRLEPKKKTVSFLGVEVPQNIEKEE